MRTMAKPVMILLSLAIMVTAMTAKEKLVYSAWCPSPLRVDGTNNDWRGIDLTFEEKVQVDFAFMNDADCFYILFILEDPSYLSSINQTGMTIYFNVDGKKNKDYGINFIQKRISAQQYLAMLEKQSGPLPEADKNSILANPDYVIFDSDVINKTVKDKTLMEPADAKPAVYRINQDQEKKIAFEFAIPLVRTSELAPGVGLEAGKQVKVGFEWGGLTEAMKKARMNRLPGRSEAEMPSDATSGEQTGERPDSMFSRRRQSPKKYDFWVDVQLASKKDS